MNAKHIFTKIMLVAVFLGTATSMAHFNKKLQLAGTSGSGYLRKHVQKPPNAPHYKIALLVPLLISGIEAILTGFKETLEQQASFIPEFHLLNPDGDRTRLRSMVEEIFMSDYDLVHSIGMEATKLLKEIGEQRKSSLPVVFNGVQRPVEAGLVVSEENSGNNLTGIAADFNYTWYVNSLLTLKPGINTVLIVYNPTQQAGKIAVAQQKVQKLLEEKNVQVSSIVVFNIEEIPQKVSPHLQSSLPDLLLVLCDNTVLSGVQHLTKLCNTYGVPLALPNLGEAHRGVAAVCFSMFDYTIGGLAVAPVRQILEEGKHPSQVPITGYGKKWQLLINPHAMKRQNLKLDRTIEFLVRHTHVVGEKIKK